MRCFAFDGNGLKSVWARLLQASRSEWNVIEDSFDLDYSRVFFDNFGVAYEAACACEVIFSQ